MLNLRNKQTKKSRKPRSKSEIYQHRTDCKYEKKSVKRIKFEKFDSEWNVWNNNILIILIFSSANKIREPDLVPRRSDLRSETGAFQKAVWRYNYR